jgi:hypothetical protein
LDDASGREVYNLGCRSLAAERAVEPQRHLTPSSVARLRLRLELIPRINALVPDPRWFTNPVGVRRRNCIVLE